MKPLRRMAFGLIVALVSVVTFITSPSASADFATGGSGLHLGSIMWAEWGKRLEEIPFSGKTASQEVKVGEDVLHFECSISQPDSGAGYGTNSNNKVVVNYPGGYRQDGLDDLYNRGGTSTQNQMMSAIYTGSSRGSFRFKISCKSWLTGSTHPTSGTSVPLGGLVIAEAETANAGEYTIVEADGGVTWHVIDRIRSSNCTATALIDRAAAGGRETLKLYPNAHPNGCSTAPTTVLFAEGISEATLSVHSIGRAGVAIGAVVNVDYGDAPVSYGQAGAVYRTRWGGAVPLGTSDVFASALSGPSEPSITLGSLIDAEQPYPPNSDGTADDATGANGRIDDEDAISGMPEYRVMPRGTASQRVTCAGTGHVRGWVDWNGNGAFDGSEASETAPCLRGSATLTWQIPPDVVAKTTYIRLRAAATRQELTQPIGITPSGEVEDHKAKVEVYSLGVSKDSDALQGKKFVGDEVTYSLKLKNTGTADFTNGNPAYLFDDLSGVLDDADLVQSSIRSTVNGAARGDANFSLTSNRISWSGQLRRQETLTLTYRVKLKLGGDRQLPNIAWGQLTSGDPATPVTCESPDDAGHDESTGLPCDTEKYSLLSLVKQFESQHNPSPDASAWRLQAHGDFGGEPDDNLREVVGQEQPVAANTFVVPTMGTYTFTETAAPEIQAGYELFNPNQLGSGGQVVALVNRDLPTRLKWVKADQTTQENLAGSVWRLTGPTNPSGLEITDCVAADPSGCTGPDHDPTAGAFLVEGLSWGVHSLTEITAPQGYEPLTQAVSADLSPSASGLITDLGTIENTRLKGSISWRKVAADGGEPLAGSVWTLTDAGNAPLADIEDCVGGSCDGMLDKDPTPGGFRVTDLAWGTWTLAEKRAPVGYYVTTRVERVQLGPDHLDHVINESFENTRMPVPVLPLTGGTPSDILMLSGGGLLAAATILLALRRHRRKDSTIAAGDR